MELFLQLTNGLQCGGLEPGGIPQGLPLLVQL